MSKQGEMDQRTLERQTNKCSLVPWQYPDFLWKNLDKDFLGFPLPLWWWSLGPFSSCPRPAHKFQLFAPFLFSTRTSTASCCLRWGRMAIASACVPFTPALICLKCSCQTSTHHGASFLEMSRGSHTRGKCVCVSWKTKICDPKMRMIGGSQEHAPLSCLGDSSL